MAGLQILLRLIHSNLLKLLLVRFTEVDARIRYGGEDHQDVSVKFASKNARSAILIDDGRDPADAAPLIDSDGNTAAPATDNDLSGFDEL